MMDTKNLYINTIGCQMNVYDSEQIAKALIPLNYRAAPSLEDADLVIVNTCSIREKAEQKAFSFLGRLSRLKRKKPGLIIGVGGCVAQQEGKKIVKRMPHIDIVFGTHAIGRLPLHIKNIELKRYRIVDIEMSEKIDEFGHIDGFQQNKNVTSFVTIMQGCENFCTYCVVPYVRGIEISRNPENIIKEIRHLVDSGVREVTLLGQNVNSYGKKEKHCSFPELLARVNEIDGLARIRFTTSHPKDLSEDLMHAFKDMDKLCRHIHLPVQSGSNRVLKKMNRKYTGELYLEKVERLRNFCPEIAITSDIIVGFPGETDADFVETLDLIEKVGFDGLFAFMYSDRPKVPATAFPDKVSKREKKERLQTLLDFQDRFAIKKNVELLGKNESVLVEGFSKKYSKNADRSMPENIQWTGRTSTNKSVNFVRRKGSVLKNYTGKMVDIKIEKVLAHSLLGKQC